MPGFFVPHGAIFSFLICSCEANCPEGLRWVSVGQIMIYIIFTPRTDDEIDHIDYTPRPDDDLDHIHTSDR